MGEVSYQGHRYPAEIIADCGWLYHRFPLSFGEVEELMLVRGVIVSYETIRQWCAKFGPECAGCAAAGNGRPISGISTRFLTINARRQYWGGPWTRTATSSTSSSSAGATPRPPSGSSAHFSTGSAGLLGCWSPNKLRSYALPLPRSEARRRRTSRG